MKKSFFSFVLPSAMMLGVMTSCNKPEDKPVEPPVEATLVLNPKSLSFDKEEAEKSFSIVSNAKWSITCSGTWITCDPVSGEGDRTSVKVLVIANGAPEVRNGTVTVKTEGGKEESVQVTQGGIDPFILIDPLSKTVACTDEEVTVTVTASGAWTTSIEEGVNWVTVTKTEPGVVLTVDANETTVERSALITFKLNGYDVQKPFTLTQAAFAPYINIDRTTAEVAAAGEDVTVAVSASGAWIAQIPGWVTIKTQTETQAVLTVTANGSVMERSTIIHFKLDGYDVQKPFTLTQEGKEPVWENNITEQAGLKNTEMPFETTGGWVNGAGYYLAKDWRTNEAGAINGNVYWMDIEGPIWLWTWEGFNQVADGHLYQTVELEAGIYRFDAYVDRASGTNTQGEGVFVYVVASLGDDLPYFYDVEKEGKSLDFAVIRETMNTVHSIEFKLSEKSFVSLGFDVTLNGSQQVGFQKIELWEGK